MQSTSCDGRSSLRTMVLALSTLLIVPGTLSLGDDVVTSPVDPVTPVIGPVLGPILPTCPKTNPAAGCGGGTCWLGTCIQVDPKPGGKQFPSFCACRNVMPIKPIRPIWPRWPRRRMTTAAISVQSQVSSQVGNS